jgi:4-amino-4-deoxy-L-arabinose transferase-like glycosyltransferase
MRGINRWEIAALTALTILFLVFASYNMGSFTMPSSAWQPSKAGTAISGEEIQVVFDLGSVEQVKEIYIFLGDAKRTKFTVYGGTPDNWTILASYDNDPAKHVHFCSWESINLGNKSTKFLKIVFGAESEGKIGELVILSAEHKKIEPVEVHGADAQRLVDEPGLIKLPITQKNGAYFDEMYFVRTAEEHLKLEEPYEWTHPPLGKLIIALGILVFGMNPFGWRIFGLLAAAAMIPLIFLFAKRLFKSSVAGIIAAFLLTFDFMHFSLARLATGEIYLFLFSLLMFYFAFDYVSKREGGAEDSEGGRKIGASTSLFLSVIFFGLGFAVKWIALFGFAAVLILVLVSDVRTKKPILSDFKIILVGLLVSVAIYIATYIPYMLSGEGHGLFFDIRNLPLYIKYISEYLSSGNVSNATLPTSPTVFDLQLCMFGYHAGITATHPFSSPWWSWPLMLKPLWMYSNTLDGMVSTVVLMGNPALWWGSIPALILIGARVVATMIKKTGDEHNFVFLFILTPFILQWLPYPLITRILFIYHFVANVPFMIFAVTYWLHLPFEKRWSSEKRGIFFKCMVIAFLILTASLFFLFYPVISGYPVAYEYKEGLRWLSGWTF